MHAVGQDHVDATVSANHPRSDWGTIVLHWTVFVAMVASLLTGFRISWDSLDSPARGFARSIQGILPSGEIWTWHFGAALILLVATVAYGVYMHGAQLFSRVSGRRLKPLAREAPKRLRWNAINVLLHWVAYLLIATLTVTGLALYLGWGGWIVTVHAVSALIVTGYVIVHVLAHYVYGGLHQLLRLFRPAALVTRNGMWTYPLAAGIVVGGAAAGTMYLSDTVFGDVLVMERVAKAPSLDPSLKDEAWAKAKPVTIRTEQGVGLGGTGTSDVVVRAVHDGKNVFFAFTWSDPTRSLKRLPLLKTADGWVIQDADAFTADVYGQYEDKFAVLFTRDPGWGDGHTSHLGPDPLPGLPKPYNQRGYHFTTDGSYAEMWQWKSTRGGLADAAVTNMDHQWMGPPKMPSDAEASGAARYQAGYWNYDGAPPYVYNYKPKVAKSGYTGVVDVPFLPKDLAATQAAMRGKSGTISLDGNEHMDADQRFWMYDDETVPYSKELDSQIPVGTIIPGVILKNRGTYTGDRGAVTAKAAWSDGRWTIVASRSVEAKAKYDQEFGPGRELYMFVAVFDHTQTRHTRHMRPVRIEVH